MSDAPGDDLGEFAGGRVVVRTRARSPPTTGSANVSFQVTIATEGLALGAAIENTADLAFQAATTGVASTVTTAPASTRVLVPDLTIGKSHAPVLAPGLPSTYTITVGNVGDGPTSGPVTVTDTLQPGLTLNGPVHGRGLVVHHRRGHDHVHAHRPAGRRQRVSGDLDPGAGQPGRAARTAEQHRHPAGAQYRRPRQRLVHRRRSGQRTGDRPARREGRDDRPASIRPAEHIPARGARSPTASP